MRRLHRWSSTQRTATPATIIVPALFNRLPGETVALGWLNEIQALQTIRQRIVGASRKTGWDIYTFHTQHNLDHFFDSTIAAVSETWANEGILSRNVIAETKRQFGSAQDYHRIQPRLVENLVFQSALMEWTIQRAEDVPLNFHVIGTALLSALVTYGSISFDTAVDTALAIGSRWDSVVTGLAEQRFIVMERLLDGRRRVSAGVAGEDLCNADAPARPFWFSPTASEEPIRIETARDVAMALESLNLNSWAPGKPGVAADSLRGWLVSPLQALAKMCRWSVSNYLLPTPAAVAMFIRNVAAPSREPILAIEPEVQNRFRLSRIKVTGP
jgi:hypothetical protein